MYTTSVGTSSANWINVRCTRRDVVDGVAPTEDDRALTDGNGGTFVEGLAS